MADPVTIQELLVSSLATSDALAKLLIEKGLITQAEFLAKISTERETYSKATESDTAIKLLIYDRINVIEKFPAVTTRFF